MSALFDTLLPAHAKLANTLAKPRRKIGAYQLSLAVLEAIWMERLRQQELLAAGKISFDCASPVVDDNRKSRVAMEELGEVCQEIDACEMITRGQRESGPHFQARRQVIRKRLKNELIQLAAVTIAWLEAMEAEDSASPRLRVENY